MMTVAADAQRIAQIADVLEGDLIELRRELHRWPELAGDEARTASAVADRLREAGLAVSTGVGGHGVVAVLDGAGPGPTIAYRADMDAIATDELGGDDLVSQVPGAAHLCGHDLHTAIGVGIAQVLARLPERPPGRVVFLFQPAEETLEGAKAMIEAGVVDRWRPTEIYAVHCGPLPVGTFAVMPGVGLPGQDVGSLEVSGPDASEAAQRLVAAITDLATIRPPTTPDEQVRLLRDLQTPNGPLERFVVADATLTSHDDGVAQIRFWLRAWPDSRYPALRDEVRQLAATADAQVEFPRPPFPAMVCSAEHSEDAAAFLRDVPGVAEVVVQHAAFPFNGEDFALFLERVPGGAMLILGVANPEAGINGAPHAPDFAADERAIGVGVRAMTGLLLRRLQELRP